MQMSKQIRLTMIVSIAAIGISLAFLNYHTSQVQAGFRQDSEKAAFASVGSTIPQSSSNNTSQLRNVYAMPSNNIKYTEAIYIIQFSVPKSETIYFVDITFPDTFNIAQAKAVGLLPCGTTPMGHCFSISNQTVTLNFAGVNLPQGSVGSGIVPGYGVNFEIGDVINGAIGNHHLTLTTRDLSRHVLNGPTVSDTFTLKR